EVRMSQLIVDRQDIAEAVPVPVDDVAQGGDEFKRLGVEGLERLVELPQAIGIIARAAGLRGNRRVLRVGDEPEAEQRLALGEGRARGKAGKGRDEGGGAGALEKVATSDHGWPPAEWVP